MNYKGCFPSELQRSGLAPFSIKFFTKVIWAVLHAAIRGVIPSE